MDNLLEFPITQENKKKRKPLAVKEVETIGFLTVDDRDLYISKPEDIAKIMAFIIRNKILITEG